MILVGHDHEVPVAQGLGVLVHLAVLQAQDLLDVLDLGIGADLSGRRLTHVEQLAPGKQAGGEVMRWDGMEVEVEVEMRRREDDVGVEMAQRKWAANSRKAPGAQD